MSGDPKMLGVGEPAVDVEAAHGLLYASELHKRLALEIVTWSTQGVCVALTIPEELGGGTSGVHGGLLVAALDVAACFAVICVTGYDCSTVDLRADFLEPAAGPSLVARGWVVRVGGHSAVSESEVREVGGHSIAVARCRFSWPKGATKLERVRD